MKVSEMVLLIFFMTFAGALLIKSLEMPYSSGLGFGAGFVPLTTSVVVIILVLLIAVRAVLRQRQIKPEIHEVLPDRNHKVPEADQQQSLLAPIGTIVLLFVATASMAFGSILLPLAILMAIISSVFLGNTWLKSIRMTIFTLVVIYLIFSVWLKIPIH